MKLKAIRTDCQTGEEKVVEQTLSIVYHPSMHEWGVQLSPGVTGYESFLIRDLVCDRKFKDWCACAGTEGRWDKLVIPENEFTVLREAVEFILPIMNMLTAIQTKLETLKKEL